MLNLFLKANYLQLYPLLFFGKKLCSYVVDRVNLLITCGFSKVHKNIYKYLVNNCCLFYNKILNL
jgi:hypothetical protein